MKINFISIKNRIAAAAAAAAMALCLPLTAGAQHSDPYPDYHEETFMDMDFEPNILTPKVPDSAKKAVAAYQTKVARQLLADNIVDIMRDDDVILVTIPTDDLFLPNDTLLSTYASRSLDKLLPMMRDPYMYKVMIAMHTDDTGSEFYREQLSLARLNSIYDWMLDKIDEGKIPEEIVIIPFSLGSNEPLKSNDTRKNRRENRRLEVYFIPGPRMIEEAQRGTLR